MQKPFHKAIEDENVQQNQFEEMKDEGKQERKKYSGQK